MAGVPALGVGIGYRHGLHRPILASLGELDFVEVVTDAFFRNGPALRALSTLLPCIPHSLNHSVGTSVDSEYLAKVAEIVSILKPPWHTDHLAYTQVRGRRVGHLAPVPHTDESLRVVVENVRRVQEAIPVPFALENITMPFYWPNSTMEEHEFITEVVQRTGCHILLDLENLRINAANHGKAARERLESLPLERVLQVHLAGGVHAQGLHHDTHSRPVPRQTWDLLEHLCGLTDVPAVLLEHDAEFPDFAVLLDQVRRARDIMGCNQ